MSKAVDQFYEPGLAERLRQRLMVAIERTGRQSKFHIAARCVELHWEEVPPSRNFFRWQARSLHVQRLVVEVDEHGEPLRFHMRVP